MALVPRYERLAKKSSKNCHTDHFTYFDHPFSSARYIGLKELFFFVSSVHYARMRIVFIEQLPKVDRHRIECLNNDRHLTESNNMQM